MPTRAELKQLVIDNLPDASEIPSVDHREVENSLIDQMFDKDEAQQDQIDAILEKLPKNIGVFRGLDVNGSTVGTILTSEGDCSSALVTFKGGVESNVLVTFNNEMDNLEYFVRLSIRSKGNRFEDNDLSKPVVVNESTTSFTFSIGEIFPSVQNIDVYFEVLKFNS